MLPIGDNQRTPSVPRLTYTLIALNCIIFLWDRQGNPFGPSVVFADLGMRPERVVTALQGEDSWSLATVFTSMFLHGNLLHLLMNMLYLLTFGVGVEWALGHWRYAIYYLFWGVMAAAAQIFVDPSSPIPVVGASGAIGGVLGAYFLLLPGNKIEIILPFVPWPIVTAAWVLLGGWFLFQIFFRIEGVANWAHAGGFMAGMATVLVMGGRQKVLAGRDYEDEFEDDA